VPIITNPQWEFTNAISQRPNKSCDQLIAKLLFEQQGTHRYGAYCLLLHPPYAADTPPALLLEIAIRQSQRIKWPAKSATAPAISRAQNEPTWLPVPNISTMPPVSTNSQPMLISEAFVLVVSFLFTIVTSFLVIFA